MTSHMTSHMTSSLLLTVIAKRRIGQPSSKVISFILNTDLDGLQPEHCELLLKFIPTQEEVREHILLYYVVLCTYTCVDIGGCFL